MVYEVLPGTVIRGALGAAWWIERAGSQEAFDGLFGSAMTVHTAVPSADGVVAQMQPHGWTRPKYPVDAAYVPSGGQHEPGRATGRGWAVPRSWMTSSTRAGLIGGVAEDGVLFTRRASHPSVSYTGHLALSDPTPDEYVQWLKRDRGISVGGQLSIMGRCSWRCDDVDDPFPPPDLDTVAITALQPLILVDGYGANSLDLAGAIREAVTRAGLDVEVSDVATRPVSVGGWHGRAGFPKPMEWALDAGSWAIVHSARRVETWSALRGGLGVRRHEGYGAIALTAPDERPVVIGAAPAAPITPLADGGEPQEVPRPTPVAGADIRELVLRVAEQDRAQAVTNLLELAREVDGIERRPMGGPQVAARLNAAKAERWCRTIPEDIVQALLDGVRTKATRSATVHVLEEMR